MSLNNLGMLLSELGQQELALSHTEEAVAIHRRLVQTNPAAFLPDLATSLTNLGLQLAALNRREQALAPAEEAIGIYRRLAEANPDTYLPDVAMSLRAYARACTMIDHNLPKALVAAGEAVIQYQQLATRLPQVFGAELRLAHRTLAEIRDRLGHTDHAARTRRIVAAADNSAEPDGVDTR
jgi:tetratricopeptide (TPR) repeat protein